ncbi:hypothetical protein ILYODFUR_017601 [Ilyodon furcidens]|uniref:Uncharacterized protein n=1 Tax=Ilyodon furcidens TaxID=33524 RepID=A0ABV0VGC8_9TELE
MKKNKQVYFVLIFILDTVHRHLELPKSSTGLLFADFSSVFNTLQLHTQQPLLLLSLGLPAHPVVTRLFNSSDPKEYWSTQPYLMYATLSLALLRAVFFPRCSSFFIWMTAALHSPTVTW